MKLFHEMNEKVKESIVQEFGESPVFLHHTGGMYGIGCFADDSDSVEKVKALKRRTDDKGFILLVPDVSCIINSSPQSSESILPIELKFTPLQKILMEQYLPGNLTFCLKFEVAEGKQGEIYKRLAVNDRIAVRCPEDRLLRDFLNLYKRPIISTSINLTGDEPANNFEQIALLDWFDFALIKKGIEKEKPRQNPFSTVIGFEDEQVVCYREGSIPFNQIQESYHHPLITFVCTGNICRSPMAEYYANKVFKEKGLPFKTASAGVFASGYPISANSEKMLKQDAISSEGHLSQPTSYNIIEKSYLVLGMEQLHKSILYNMFPSMKHKVFTLAEYCDEELDVSDPYTKDKWVYKDTYLLIKKYVDILVLKLQEKLKQY